MSAYSFSLDRKGLVTVVAGLSTVGVLLFFTGVLVGVGVRVPDDLSASPAPAGALAAAGARDEEGAPGAGPGPGDAAPARTVSADAPEEYGTGGPGDDEPLYAVQVAEYPREEPALELMERLGRRGYDAYLVSGYDDGWRLRMQVRFGVYDDEDAALLAADEVAAREGVAATVVAAGELVP